MRIELSDDAERYVRDQVAKGRFASECDVVETAIRLMRDRAEKREALRVAMMDEEGVPLARRA
jgi:putative addiction module CopG family antidote